MATQSATRGPVFYRGFYNFVMPEGEFDLHPLLLIQSFGNSMIDGMGFFSKRAQPLRSSGLVQCSG
jgi:hypothetical protein